MSFALNKLKSSSEVTTLMSIRPRRRLQDWTVNGTFPAVWETPWDERLVVGVYGEAYNSAGEELSLADCNANQDSWYYDPTAKILYFNPAGSADPNDIVTVVEWDFLVATDHLNWFRSPTNSSSGDAVWEGGLVRPPIPTQGNPDLIFGYQPLQVTEIQVQIADGLNLEHLHSWSLNNAQVRVWECIGPLEIGNISEIFTGVGRDFSMQSGVLSIQVADPLQVLETAAVMKFFSGADFGSLDPEAQGLPIRTIYGYLDSFLPVNIDYSASPSTSNNRRWVVCNGDVNDGAGVTTLVQHLDVANDATHTKVADASAFYGVNGFGGGDQVRITDNGIAKYTVIRAVDYVTNILTHDSIGARTPVVTDQVDRGFCSKVVITRGPAIFYLRYGRDWLEFNEANGTRGFRLANNFEANHGGLTTFDPTTDVIYCSVYGTKVLPKQLDGITDFGSLSQGAGAVANPVVILWDILRNQVRNFREIVSLDQPSWLALANSFDRVVGIAIPDERAGEFPTWAEVAQRLLETELLKMHFKISSGLNALTVTQIAPTTGDGTEVTDEELSDAKYRWDFSDIASVIRCTMNAGELASPLFNYDEEESAVAKYLHRVEKVFKFDSLYARFDLLPVILRRLSFILSERRGTISGRLPLAYVENSIDDKIVLATDRLPGAAFSGSINQRAYKLAEHAKSSGGVEITLDDQKGVEDNAGDW